MTERAPFVVHRLRVEDAVLAVRAIREIKRHGFAEAVSMRTVPEMQAWLSDPRHVLLVATDVEDPIGFALGYVLERIDGVRPMLFFYEIEVVEPFRRRGVGRALVTAIQEVGRQENVVRVWVQTSPDSVPARALYHGCGGKERDEVDVLYVWTNGRDG